MSTRPVGIFGELDNRVHQTGGSLSAVERSVLLVDDDSMVRGWVRLALKGTEFRLAGEATTPEEATELVDRRRPDVLLVDFHLGKELGTEFVRALRQSGFRAPV